MEQRRKTRFLAVLLALALGAAACGGGDGGTSDVVASEAPTFDEPIEIDYWLWDGNQQPFYEQCAADFTANVDLFPTICSALGVAAPAAVEGRSLADHVAGRPTASWRDHVRYDMSFADHARPATAVEDCRFSVVRTLKHRLVTFPAMAPMLFDLENDPNEIADRAGDPALKTVMADLLERRNAIHET